MHAHTILATAMALAIGLAGARPANADPYATFYDDDACTQNGGEPVDVTNPGCLNEGGRNSIYFQAALDPLDYALVLSPSPDCPCQEDCIGSVQGTDAGYCYNLDGHPSAQSFRFISGGCSPNNC